MKLIGEYAGAAGAVFKRDLLIWASYRWRLVTQFIAMLLSITTFYYVSRLVRPDVVGPGDKYFAFVVVGIVIMAVLTASLSIPELLRIELVQGNFERTLVSPLGPLAGAISLAVFPVVFALLTASVMLAVAMGIYGIPVRAAGILPAIPVALLGVVAFSSIGLLFVASLFMSKQATGLQWIIAGLGLVGGVYFPTTLFPGWIQWVSEVQPFTPALDVLRHLLVGTPTREPMWLEIGKLAGFAAVLIPIASALLMLAVRVSRRRGTLLEF